ncbi:hypothetical protein U1Q18_002613, partial [Sarracenia purpurea var. burkii]
RDSGVVVASGVWACLVVCDLCDLFGADNGVDGSTAEEGSGGGLCCGERQCSGILEPSPSLRGDTVFADSDLANQGKQAPNSNISSLGLEIQVSDEQKARMEANRLKALERAAARART